MNKVILIGRLTKDPDLRFAAGTGTAVTKFTLAVNRQFKREGQPEADFINCIAFGKTAETISQHLTKGRQMALEGHIQTGSYDAEDGTKRYTTDVLVDRFEFIGSSNVGSKENTGSANNNSSNGLNSEFNNPNNFSQSLHDDGMTPIDDGDIPF